jgi:hypothetical protein
MGDGEEGKMIHGVKRNPFLRSGVEETQILVDLEF